MARAMACISVCAFIGLSMYSVDRHSTSKPVSHMAHTTATRNGCFGSLKAVSTSTRLLSGVSKPCFISARCGMMSKPQRWNSAPSPWASLTINPTMVWSSHCAWASRRSRWA